MSNTPDMNKEREAQDGHWYMVTNDGVAMLCANESDAHTEVGKADKLYPSCAPHRAVRLVEAGRASLSAEAEPTINTAAERDALLQVAIDFIGTLTGMTPPPIEVAPPEVFAPFHAFVEKVQAITRQRAAPAQAPAPGWASVPVEPTPPIDGEIALIEKALERVGITSLLNHGAASCVFTEGCCGVSQEHIVAYTREIALHCAVALSAAPSSGKGD